LASCPSVAGHATTSAAGSGAAPGRRGLHRALTVDFAQAAWIVLWTT
jgi:hypothetical protein